MPTSVPLVSILTPSFNQARWLPDNLHSVSCQTYPSIEHIVMDGGSTDGSLALLKTAGDSIVWRSEPDEGQSDAVNKAFRASRGEIIGWLNSDDAYFDCHVIGRLVDYFAAHPEVDVVYGHALQTTAEGAAIQVLWVPPFDEGLLHALDFIVQPAAFVRRTALSDPMLDDSYHFAMDYELWLRLASAGRRFRRLNRLMAIDRHQAERKSSTAKDVYRENLDRLATEYPMHLGSEWDSERSAFYRRQRIRGAFLTSRIKRRQLAFSAPEDVKKGLLTRQILTRRSTWPAGYR